MNNYGWNGKIGQWAYAAGIFLILFIFFTQANMLVPYDGDDWANLSMKRKFLPAWGSWNPIKILPETLFPLVGYVAAYVIKPLTGNYIYSITLVSAGVLSGIIVVYVLLFRRWLEKFWGLSLENSYIFSFIFFLIHFLIFKGNGTSQFLFGSTSLTNTFHYLIPALWNACLVLFFWQQHITGKLPFEQSLKKCSILLIILYLAVFSNILSSIILISYICICLVWKVMHNYSCLHTKSALIDFVRENRFFILILAVWFISLVYEANGGRSHQIGKSIMQLPADDAAMAFFKVVKQLNIRFICLLGAVSIAAGCVFRKYKGTETNDAIKQTCVFLIAAMAMTGMYLLLVCAKSAPSYMGRSDVVIGIFFWVILLLFSASAYIIKQYPKIFIILPFVVLFLAVETMGSKGIDGHYAEITMRRAAPSIAVQIDEELLENIMAADRMGMREMTLVVPKGDNIDNWPHPTYMGNNISRTLYMHGIISRPLSITVQPSAEMNKKYCIPVPK